MAVRKYDWDSVDWENQSNKEIVEMLNISGKAQTAQAKVSIRRRLYGKPRKYTQQLPDNAFRDSLLGKYPDTMLAEYFKVSRQRLEQRRKKLGIKSFQQQTRESLKTFLKSNPQEA